MKLFSSAFLPAVLAAAAALAQPTGTSPLDPPPNGPRHEDPTWHALTHATVHVSPAQVLDDAMVVVRDGRIVSVGAGDAPAGARVWDCTGLHVYAGFIDPYVEVDAPRPAAGAPGVHWNSRVTPQRSALDGPVMDEGTAGSLRKLGFAAAIVSPRGGVFRGSSALVSLAAPATESSADRPPVYTPVAYQAVAFETGGFGGGDQYPGSQMGAIALVRQTLIDETWQRDERARGAVIPPNALDGLRPWRGPDGLPSAMPVNDARVQSPPMVPLLFDCRDELEVLRAIKVAGEFSRTAVILGSGSEFKRLAAIAGVGKPIFIEPLNFPRAPDVAGVGKAESVDVRELMAWEQAPTNPRRMLQAGLHVALTTARLRDRGEFAANLRKAIAYGLSPADALAGLTTVPAMIGNTGDLGQVKAGMRANLVVADGDLFAVSNAKKPDPTPDAAGPAPKGDSAKAERAEGKPDAKDAKVRDVWIDGARYEVNAAPDETAVGMWTVIEADGKPVPEGDPAAPGIIIDDKGAVTVQVGEKKVKATSVHVLRGRADYVYDTKEFGGTGLVADQATIQGKEMIGVTRRADGSIHRWKAKYTGEPPKEAPRARGTGDRLSGNWVFVMYDGEPVAPERQGVMSIAADGAITITGKGKDIWWSPPERVTPADVKVEGDKVSFHWDLTRWGGEVFEASATRTGDKLAGKIVGLNSKIERTWEAALETPPQPDKPASAETPAEKPDPTKDIPETLAYPFGPYGVEALPPQERLVVTNATLWTSGPQGIIKEGALVIDGGKIVYVGPAASLPALEGAPRTIDAGGRPVTAGLIDCHSHTGISGGVNEGTQSCTAEVRIGDVTDPDSINWYRQIAGGLTVVNSLHGSANPMGGQNQVNKIRWGARSPDDMHFEGAQPGIKFALGENVKRSRSPDNTRYPDTRMGVEAFMRDRFTAAREYAAARSKWEASDKTGPEPRRDLELDALAEILAGTRLVHCHSYRQDEILMLARLSAGFGFRLGTYQHGLECYKVADTVREAARGASIFSDWWAYKVEVQDAIPQAGPILHEQGVVVSYNSDSDELARRLNVEAAKAVKYGGVKPEEAIKFVTINPAIQLNIADRVGSLEAGKDADFVIWSGDPLSAFSRCQATYIDGREYFSLEKDAAARQKIASERTRLIQKVLTEGKSPGRPGGDEGGGPGAPGGRRRPPSGADRDAALIEAYYLDRSNRGLECDVCGECGLEIEHLLGGESR
ncbi:MAG: amidohydrolase family protein [Phycisphaerales bacterium]|nr:amidohydrolase family protein [Phycisphaerales bacterium]